VSSSEAVPSQEVAEARELLFVLLEAAYGSAKGARDAVERALERAKRAEFPASVPEIMVFVCSGLVHVLTEDLGPRRTIMALDGFITKQQARSGVRVKERAAAEPAPGRTPVRPRDSAPARAERRRILLVDADPVGRSSLARALQREGYQPTAIASVEELGVVTRATGDFEVVVLDDRHPAKLVIMEMVVERFPAVSLVVRTAGEASTRTLLGTLGVTQFEVLAKQASSQELVDAVRKVAAKKG
jgi:ActR/RegA family two-component response regulator